MTDRHRNRPAGPANRGALFPWLGHLLVSAAVLILYGFTASQIWRAGFYAEIPILITMIGLAAGVWLQWQRVAAGTDGADRRLDPGNAALQAGLVVAGAIVTYTLKVQVGLGPIVAASLTAIVASIVLPAYGVPIYTGAFVGMTSARLLVNHGELALAASVAGVIYPLAANAFKGYGGKLSAIAFCGTLSAGLVLRKTFLPSALPEAGLVPLIILTSMAATMLTHWFNIGLGHGGVMASGVVGLMAGLILPRVLPGETGTTLAVMAMCASFAGMSTRDRLGSVGQAAAVGLLAGLIYIFSTSLIGGAGGKLGVIAFGAGISVQGWRHILTRLKGRKN